jgi:hypothetical protein
MLKNTRRTMFTAGMARAVTALTARAGSEDEGVTRPKTS